MAVSTITYDTVTTITLTGTSLASSATAGRESTAISNAANLYLDALVFAQTKLATGTPGNDKAIYVFVYGSLDEATPVYPDAVTGTDAAITLNDPTQLRVLGVINAPTSAGTFKGGPWSVAACFGGVMPKRWGLVVRNYTGIALSSTAGDHVFKYQGIKVTTA